MNVPALNPNVPLGIKVFTDLVVGGIIRNSDPAVQAARAAMVVQIATEIQVAAQTGDPTAIMNAVDNAIAAVVANKANDPAVAAIAATAIGWIATKAAAFQQFLSGSVVGSVGGLILSQAATEAISLAQKYIPATAKA